MGVWEVLVMKRKLMTKKEQRLLAMRRRAGVEDKKALSKRIADFFMETEEYKKAGRVALYAATLDEVDTSEIIENALNSKQVYLPVTKEEIHMTQVTKSTVFIKGAFGIWEPEGGEEINDCELVAVPMVAFDLIGNRLGHGKGFYDRFLKDKNCFKIGLAFSAQKIDIISASESDVKMDMIITEQGIVYPKEYTT